MSEKKYTVIETDEDGYKRSYELTAVEILEKMEKEGGNAHLEYDCWQQSWNELMECDWRSIPELAEGKWLQYGVNREKRAMKLFKEMKQEMAEDFARLVKEQDLARRQLQHYNAQMVEFEILTRNPQEESEVIS